MDINSGFGEVLERGQTTVKKAAKQTVSDFAQAVKGQITGNQNDQGTNEQANAAQNQQKMSDEEAKKFLGDLYGKSDQSSNSNQKIPPGKTPEEIAKIEILRKQLHGRYYDELINPKKPEPEEAVVEKIEREDQEEKMELWEKDKKKPPPLPATVKQGTGESVVGVSG